MRSGYQYIIFEIIMKINTFAKTCTKRLKLMGFNEHLLCLTLASHGFCIRQVCGVIYPAFDIAPSFDIPFELPDSKYNY